MKILIMGLPGSGKTWLGKRLGEHFSIPYWDADDVRRIYNDWDFSVQGREFQALRMRKLAELDSISISGFVCPLPGLRKHFFPDKLIWMDTIEEGRFDNTNKIFEPPIDVDHQIKGFMSDDEILNFADILKVKYHV